jgi:ATP-dependent Clp protease ATP-binding subunit ClpB
MHTLTYYAVDLVDEACSRLRLEQESKPEILWQLERDLLTRQIEASALASEKDDAKAMARQRHVQQQVEDLQAEIHTWTDTWMSEKNALNRVKQVQQELEEARHALEGARRQGDFNKAGELLHGTIPNLEDELLEVEAKADQAESHKMLAEAVTADAVATLIARHTGIPVSRIAGNESKKLLQMEDNLRKRVVGQDHALEAVSNAVRLARTRLQAHDRTLGNFLFLGPTGVGKTETAKALAEFLFDNEDSMTRIDMSEYSEKHTVSRLIGAPPGYIGYDEGGVLTESVRRRPYQVLLLDEFEKAHKDVWNILLQLFDEGHLTDSHGRKVDFRNVIVVMTSNMGAHLIADLPSHFKGSEPEVRDQIMEHVRHQISPELLNRIDDSVIFNRLQRENMDTIADIGIKELTERLEDVQNMTLDVSSAAKSCLSEMGFDVRYGARPLKRVITNQLLNPLSQLILQGAIREGDTVSVRTRAEAGKDQRRGKGKDLGWLSANRQSEDKNDVVVVRNHENTPDEEDALTSNSTREEHPLPLNGTGH